jgi:AcrR family transcriptional regulator
MVRLFQRRKELWNSMMQDAIYAAAVAVLTEHGVSGMTMDRVAEQAEVAKGSLYRYFPNKAELMRFVHQRAIEPMLCAGQDILQTDATAPEKLRSLLRAWLEYLAEHRGLFSFFVTDATVRGMLQQEEETGRASGTQNLAAIIQQGIDQQVFREVDAMRVAGCLFGAIRHMCEQQLAKDGPWPVDQLTEELTDFFIYGLAANRFAGGSEGGSGSGIRDNETIEATSRARQQEDQTGEKGP